MRKSVIKLFVVLLVFLFSKRLCAQNDSQKYLVSKHWTTLKDAHRKLLETTTHFCSITQVKSKYPTETKELADNSTVLLTFLNNTIIIDSAIAGKIDSMTYLLHKSIGALFNKLEMEQSLSRQNEIRVEGKKIEHEIENVAQQIHQFNYWIYEKNKINIKFKDVGL